MTIWHNLAGVILGLFLIALGRWMVTRARTIADITIDFESSHPANPENWGGKGSRQIETRWNRFIGHSLVAFGAVFGLLSAGQFMSRIF